MKLLAQESMDKIFGKITPPGPFTGDPKAELSRLIAFGIRMTTIVAGFFLLVYLLWGAFDWINSGGDKEKLTKAQQKITQAIIGILIIFVVIGVWGYITGDILGIIKRDPVTGSWSIPFPTF